MTGPETLRPSSDRDYRVWIERDAARRRSPPLAALRCRPLVSVVRPRNDRTGRTAAMLEAQSYPDWELVPTADDAAGAFVALPAPGDAFAADGLLAAALSLDADPDADIVYGDDDLIDPADATRRSPWFKTGWDPDLLLADDLFGGLALYRRSILARLDQECLADPRRLGWEAARLTAPDRIRHVPRILSHRAGRRAADGASVAALQRHLDRHAPGARASAAGDGRHRVRWPLPSPAPLATVLVPTRNRADLLGPCADGVLRRTDYPAIELLVVDNGSTEPETVSLLGRLAAADERVRIVATPGPFDHSAMNNRAAREARGDVLVLLNDDVEILDEGWLRELVSQALRPEVGAAGAKLLTPDGRVQHGGVTLAPGPVVRHVLDGAAAADPGFNGQLSTVREFSAVTAACLAIRRAVFDEAGGFDASSFPTSYNDVDLCFRLRDLGYRIVWTPFATLLHRGSASRPRLVDAAALQLDRSDLDRLCRRWCGEIEADPFSPAALRLYDTAEVLFAPPPVAS